MIIKSLLDTDFYKFSMQQAVFKKFPAVEAEFKFKLRNYPKDTLVPYVDEINEEIDHLCSLRFKEDELTYLLDIPYMDAMYVDFLSNFKLNRDHIYCRVDDGELKINIAGASWLDTILFEVPVLSIVSEVYFRNHPTPALISYSSMYKKAVQNLKYKVKKYRDDYMAFKFADFGTRRRFSYKFQDYMLKYISKYPYVSRQLTGTSNVYFAKKYNLKPIGTMAHEWIQGMQALSPLRDSQKFAFQNWADVYRGNLGIALSDTLGMDAFFNDFDLYFAKLYDGARHDSGNPYTWTDKLLSHYSKLGIDSRTKTAVYSDGLTFDTAHNLYKKYNEHIKPLFGIGTYLTNDTGVTPLQIVIKMTKCNGQPVAKLSDSPGKQMCEDTANLKRTFGIKGK